jgi:NADH dehydrogenase
VELVGQIAEIATHTLNQAFRSIDPAKSQIYLIEAVDRILPSFQADLPAKAQEALTNLGVNVLTSARVTQIEPESICLERAGKCQQIAARTVLWAAGVHASPLGRILADAAGIATDRSGRVPIGADLTVAGHPELFVIGDMAALNDAAGQPLPALAPVAMQQGVYAARLIRERLTGGKLPPFRYHDRGTLATIGRWRAVADLRIVRLAGPLAWLAWLFVHLMTLVQFRNRILVFVQWGWHYLTRDRAALLITGKTPIGPAAMDTAASEPQRDGQAKPQTQQTAQRAAVGADAIQETSEESFPASDPPAWNHSAISRDP